MNIGQVMFFVSTGHRDLYAGKYQGSAGPQPSRSWHDARLPEQARERVP
jgi:dCTP deaminase